MKSGPVSVLVVLIAAAAAFAVGRWTADPSPEPPTVPKAADDTEKPANAAQPEKPPAVPEESPPPAPESKPAAEPEPTRSEVLLAELADIADAAQTMPVPDARTYGFFEQLTADDLEDVVDFLENLPRGNEQDALLALALRRWAQIDGRSALERASTFPRLGIRVENRVAVYQEWAAVDAESALVRAAEETDDGALRRAVSAVLVGAATADPENAFSLLDVAPVKFLKSPAVPATIERMVNAAYGTGKREELLRLIERMPPGDVRSHTIDTLARNWGAHFPSETYAWLKKVVPEGDRRAKIVQNLFTAIAFKDPSLAAKWVVQELADPDRTKYLAAAVSQWAQLDLRGVEIWLNELPANVSVDGGSLALADYFMKERRLSRAFSWIRRINQDEMRTKLYGDLGRMWSEERPEEFQRFLDETSLNSAEVELLTAEAKPSS